MKSEIKNLTKIENSISNNFEINIENLSKALQSANNLCKDDYKVCNEVGLEDKINFTTALLDSFQIQKQLFIEISDSFSKTENYTVSSEFDEILIKIDGYLAKYPNCSRIEDILNFRDELLFKKFWIVSKFEVFGSTITSYAYDALIPTLEDYLIKIRKEQYRQEISDKIREIKEERDRVRENEIMEEHLEEQRRLQEEQYEAQQKQERQRQTYLNQKSRAFNSLAIAMEDKAESIASKGHSFHCTSTKVSESVVSQYDNGSRVEITKRYKIKIGGLTCSVSYEYVTVSGYVSYNGYDSASYKVTGGEK